MKIFLSIILALFTGWAVGAPLALRSDSVGEFSAQDVNLSGSLRLLRSTLASNLPPKILILSDNAFSTHEALPVCITNWLPLNGSLGKCTGTQLGNYFYNAWNGLGSFSAEDGTDSFFARSHFNMADSCLVSNISASANGFSTAAIQIRGWKLSTFGSLEIYTNSFGGTRNLFRTVDCASGASLTAFVTNWTIPLHTNLVVTVKSIGTNILMDIGQWDTNKFSGAVWDFWESGNFGFAPFTDTAAHSNYFRTFVRESGYHLVIMDDQAGSNSLFSGMADFAGIFTNSGIGFIATTAVAPTNDLPTWLGLRYSVRTAAAKYNFGALDVASLFLDLSQNGWYYDDYIHQNRTLVYGGARIIGGELVRRMGLGWENFSSFGYTNLAIATASKWVNVPLLSIKPVNGTVTPTSLGSGTDTGSPHFYDVAWNIPTGGSCSFRFAVPYGNGSRTMVHRLQWQCAGQNYWTNLIYNSLRFDRTTGRQLGSTVETVVPGFNGVVTSYMTNVWANDSDPRQVIVAVNPSTNTATKYLVGWEYLEQ